MHLLVTLQRLVEHLHGVNTCLDVRDFLIDDDVRKEMVGGASSGDALEQLLIRENPQDPDDIDVGLYLNPRILAHLQQQSPMVQLHAQNLESTLIVVEGISHFVLLATRAEKERPVSALEMEIQAEVDKFVVAWLLLKSQGVCPSDAGRALVRCLFEQYAIQECIDEDTAVRYHVASRVARQYCKRLLRRYSRDRKQHGLAKDVRDFCQTGLAEKLRAA